MVKDQHAATGPPTWTNRIHADDAAGVLHHILKLKEPDDLYLASDDLPVFRHDVLNWLAVELGLPDSARVIPGGQAMGRRIDASRLRRSAYHMHYPDYRSGYRSMLAEDQND
jgi:hypothetical protein